MAKVDWIDDALCAQVDSEIFYPQKGASAAGAKKICGLCPVREECLEDALATGDQWGIRGGVSERNRAKILRAREAAA